MEDQNLEQLLQQQQQNEIQIEENNIQAENLQRGNNVAGANAAEQQQQRSRLKMSRNESYINAISERCALIKAENAAQGEPLDRFVPATRGAKGYIKRKRDEGKLGDYRRRSPGRNLDLYSMRVMLAFREERRKDANRPETQFAEDVEKALTWKLSEQMLTPRYMYYHAAEIYDIRRTYNKLKEEEGANTAYLNSLPQVKADSYSAIMEMTRIFLEQFDAKIRAGGFDVDTGEVALNAPERLLSDDEFHASFSEARTRLLSVETKLEKGVLWKKVRKNISVNNRDLAAFKANIEAEVTKNGRQKTAGEQAKDADLKSIARGMSVIGGLGIKDCAAIYKGLAIGVGQLDKRQKLSAPDKKTFVETAEKVFRAVLYMDMSKLKVNGDEDLARPEIINITAVLAMGNKLTEFVGFYKQLRHGISSFDCTLSESLLAEVEARLSVMANMNLAIRGRVNLLGNNSYWNYTDQELNAMDDKTVLDNRDKAEDEEKFMFEELIMIRQADGYKIGDEPEDALVKARKKIGCPESSDFSVNLDKYMQKQKNADQIANRITGEINSRLATGTLKEKIVKAVRSHRVLQGIKGLNDNLTISNACDTASGWFINEDHKTVDFLNAVLEYQEELKEKIYQKFLQERTRPVPKEFLKEGVEATDQEAMDEFALGNTQAAEDCLDIGQMSQMLAGLCMDMPNKTVKSSEGNDVLLEEYIFVESGIAKRNYNEQKKKVIEAIMTNENKFKKLNKAAKEYFNRKVQITVTNLGEQEFVSLMNLNI